MVKHIEPTVLRFFLETFKVTLTDSQSKNPEYNLEELKKGIVYYGTEPIPDMVLSIYGYDFVKMNQTLHKDFATVINMDPVEYYTAQLLHYFGTYGMESFGMEPVCIVPDEILAINPNAEAPKVTLIREVTIADGLALLKDYINSGIALDSSDVLTIKVFFEKYAGELPYSEWEKIKNREVKLVLGKLFNYQPSDPEEFIKGVVYGITNNPCLVKNHFLFNTINSYSDLTLETIYKAFQSYIGQDENNIIKLAGIFNRYKMVFLALRDHHKVHDKKVQFEMNSLINKISKLSKKHHKPMKKNLLDTLVQDCMNRSVNILGLQDALSNPKVTTYRLVRLANALAFASSQPTGLSYTIRNGKSFSKENHTMLDDVAKQTIISCLYVIRKEIEKRLYFNMMKYPELASVYEFTGSPIDIEFGQVDIAAPTSEKRFVGDIPCGSLLSVYLDNQEIVAGIHWYNLDKTDYDGNSRDRVDLDLHCYNNGTSISWCSKYNDKGITFSGDMTTAPMPYGAAEFVRITLDKITGELFSLDVALYTHNDAPVPFRFFIASSKGVVESTVKGKGYIIDPHEVMYDYTTKLAMGERSLNIGTFQVLQNNVMEFTFSNDIADCRVPSDKEYHTWKRIANIAKSRTCLKLSHLGISVKDKSAMTKANLIQLFE